MEFLFDFQINFKNRTPKIAQKSKKLKILSYENVQFTFNQIFSMHRILKSGVSQNTTIFRTPKIAQKLKKLKILSYAKKILRLIFFSMHRILKIGVFQNFQFFSEHQKSPKNPKSWNFYRTQKKISRRIFFSMHKIFKIGGLPKCSFFA